VWSNPPSGNRGLPAASTIVGGMFGLHHATVGAPAPPFLQGGEILTLNGRSAIRLVTEKLSPATVWLPSYLCEAAVEAMTRPGMQIRFFAVSYDLTIDPDAAFENVRAGDLVVLIDYFGVPSPPELAAAARQRQAWILKDASQALLTEGVDAGADFVVFSPRKFVGVPDGGILRPVHGWHDQLSLGEPPRDCWLQALAASALRALFDMTGEDLGWFGMYQASEIAAPIGPYTMSALSQELLTTGINFAEMAERRVINYGVLSSLLHECALIPSLPPGAVPLGFPIRIPDRARARQALFAERIYPMVHWPIEGVVPRAFTESHRLADELLTLPCDQRYDGADMERIAATILAR
jgi:dTDP-4-amino-4,6-dideoxygalactose transaminase